MGKPNYDLPPIEQNRGSNSGPNRRQLAVLISAATYLAGCDNSGNEPKRTATLLNKSGVQDALNGLDSAIGDLQSKMAGFDSDNWRDVVPEVESSASSVRGAFDTLKAALGVSD